MAANILPQLSQFQLEGLLTPFWVELPDHSLEDINRALAYLATHITLSKTTDAPEPSKPIAAGPSQMIDELPQPVLSVHDQFANSVSLWASNAIQLAPSIMEPVELEILGIENQKDANFYGAKDPPGGIQPACPQQEPPVAHQLALGIHLEKLILEAFQTTATLDPEQSLEIEADAAFTREEADPQLQQPGHQIVLRPDGEIRIQNLQATQHLDLPAAWLDRVVTIEVKTLASPLLRYRRLELSLDPEVRTELIVQRLKHMGLLNENGTLNPTHPWGFQGNLYGIRDQEIPCPVGLLLVLSVEGLLCYPYLVDDIAELQTRNLAQTLNLRLEGLKESRSKESVWVKAAKLLQIKEEKSSRNMLTCVLANSLKRMRQGCQAHRERIAKNAPSWEKILDNFATLFATTMTR